MCGGVLVGDVYGNKAAAKPCPCIACHASSIACSFSARPFIHSLCKCSCAAVIIIFVLINQVFRQLRIHPKRNAPILTEVVKRYNIDVQVYNMGRAIMNRLVAPPELRQLMAPGEGWVPEPDGAEAFATTASINELLQGWGAAAAPGAASGIERGEEGGPSGTQATVAAQDALMEQPVASPAAAPQPAPVVAAAAPSASVGKRKGKKPKRAAAAAVSPQGAPAPPLPSGAASAAAAAAAVASPHAGRMGTDLVSSACALALASVVQVQVLSPRPQAAQAKPSRPLVRATLQSTGNRKL